MANAVARLHRVELGHHARVARNCVIDVRASPIMMETFRVLHDVRNLSNDAAGTRMLHSASGLQCGGTQWHALSAAAVQDSVWDKHAGPSSIELVTAEEPR